MIGNEHICRYPLYWRGGDIHACTVTAVIPWSNFQVNEAVAYWAT